MSLLTVTVQHQLGQEEATRRLKVKKDEIQNKHTYTVTDLRENWTSPHSMDFGFKVLGFSLTGSVTSAEDVATIAVELPIAAMIMRGTIESEIRKELTQVLT